MMSIDILLRAFLHSWPVAVLLFGREREIIYGNLAARSLVESPLEALTPAERAERWTLRDEAGRLVSAAESPSGRALRGETVVGADYQLVFADGRRRRITIDAYPLREPDGAITAVACVLVEKSETAVRIGTPYRLFEGLKEWLESTQRTGSGIPALVAETGHALTTSLDYETVMETIVRAVVPRLADWCAIRILEANGRVRRSKVACARPELAGLVAEMEEYYATRTDLTAYPPTPDIGAALRTRQPMLVTNVTDQWLQSMANDARHLELLRHIGAVSLMNVPLLANERTVGVITFIRTAGRALYEMRDLALAEELCDRAAVAIENTQLFRESERRRHEAQVLADVARMLAETTDPALVAQRIADSVRLLLDDISFAAVYSFESTHEPARAVAIATDTEPTAQLLRVMPPGTGGIALAVARRRPIVAPDALEHPDIVYPTEVRVLLEASASRAIMAIPLVARDRVLGALAVGARTGRHFEERETALLSAFADHAAVSFHNARLFDELDRRGRDAERARTAAETANRSKDDFLAVLSHELRSPLTAILGWVRMLERGVLSSERRAEALGAIDRNTRLQARLINDLLDVSRIVTGKLDVERQPVSLALVVGDVVASARQDPHARDVLEEPVIPPDTGLVIGDRLRLQQVVTNLVSNAVKHTPRGGRVEISLRHTDDQVAIVVADTGEGIDPAELPLIFERFHQVDASKTRRHGGLGLGLTIVRHLVELHGGSVRAESRGRGHGATFTMTLPRADVAVAPGQAPPRPEAAPTPAATLRGVRVLFLDDNRDARVFVRVALETAGADVQVAESAHEALGLFDAKPFDVVLSDIGMPDIDGYDFVRLLRARGASVPVIALTAYASTDDERQALAAGFQRHVAKPIDPVDLVAVVRSVIETRTA